MDHAGVILGADEAAELHRRTEGWADGLHIAALAIKAGSRDGETAPAFSGDDIFMRDYLRSEVLDRLPEVDALFLTRTSALERMSGPLCDAVLGLQGSAATLAALAQSDLLVVPLDRRGRWYRYHHLFRDLLLAELDRLEPGLVPVLRRRAAQWHEGNGRPDEALEYWMQAGDADSVARLATVLTFPAYQRGMVATAERWLRWLQDRADVEDYPAAAMLAALLAALTGKPDDAERWARAAERGAAVTSLPDGSPSIQPWLALLRALLCRDGAAQMRADAELAAATMAGGSFWRTSAILYLGMAHLMARRSGQGRCPLRGRDRRGPAGRGDGRTLRGAGRTVAAGGLPTVSGIRPSGTWARPRRWRATPKSTTTRQSPSCTPPPRGSRCIGATGSEPARNWP